jgi:Flp pilus assembly protein TadG
MRLSCGRHTRICTPRRHVLPLPRRLASQHRERGGLSLMIAILFVPLAALAGIVVDGSAKLEADQNAVAAAQEAARAGAATVDRSSAYSSGSFVIDRQQALRAARSYLIAAGYGRYAVAVAGTGAIQVSVTISEPTRFLSLIGVDSFTCTGTATASLVTGVTRGT